MSTKVTPAQIAEWKKANPEGVWKITDKSTKKVCYIKSPDRDTVSYATTLAATDPLGFVETIIESSFLGGEQPEPNSKNLLGLTKQLDTILDETEYELEKC